VTFSQMDGDNVVNGFTFGIRSSAIESTIFSNLDSHYGIFTRVANQVGIAQAKAEAAAAKALLRDKDKCSSRYLHRDRYMRFLSAHVREIAGVVSAIFAKEHSKDSFLVRPSLEEFQAAVRSGDLTRAASAHMALLEKLDSFVLMLQLRNGNPLDVLQMTRWQKELYTTIPQLKDLSAAQAVVKESDEFINAYSRHRETNRYTEMVKDLKASFRETASALAKSGVNVKREVAELEGQAKSIAGLEKAHREYLLKLSKLSK
ncbi:MAG TPA: hypothetical protein VMT89_16990, partial [Candidatus Acidoferrales bacterium]|nr:hypothetical protein [Candidatus Acidoferrales bacterium]